MKPLSEAISSTGVADTFSSADRQTGTRTRERENEMNAAYETESLCGELRLMYGLMAHGMRALVLPPAAWCGTRVPRAPAV